MINFWNNKITPPLYFFKIKFKFKSLKYKKIKQIQISTDSPTI